MLSPEQVTPAFVDAHRVWSTLEAVLGAPNLYTAATEKFPSLTMPHGPDKEAFELLVADDFLEVPIELRNDIDRFRQLDQSAERVREELAAVYRRLKTLNLQHRNATRDADQATGFLRSKSKQWQAKQRVGALQQEIEDLTLKRRRQESDLEKCGALLRSLLDRIYRDQGLRDGHWFCEAPVLVTHHGDFLSAYLAEMNPAHFLGRTLGEILEIGASLP